MTIGRKPPKGKGKARRLKLKKETLKDLDALGKSRGVRGGARMTVGLPCSDTCLDKTVCCIIAKTVGCPLK
jgi:hypothetical protein